MCITFHQESDSERLENRSTFAEVMIISQVYCFLRHTVHFCSSTTQFRKPCRIFLCICQLKSIGNRRIIVPGIEDEFLQLAGGRMQFTEDDVAARERPQPVGDESADEHHRVGGGHHRQVHASRRARHLRPRHHGQYERVAMTSPAHATTPRPRDDVTVRTSALPQMPTMKMTGAPMIHSAATTSRPPPPPLSVDEDELPTAAVDVIFHDFTAVLSLLRRPRERLRSIVICDEYVCAYVCLSVRVYISGTTSVIFT